MSLDTLAFAGGFQKPVFEAQAVFRTLMDCMARPGTIGRVAAAVTPPAPLNATAGAVALTLCDHDTSVWLTPVLAKSALPGWLAFNAGATVTEERQDARFAFVEKGAMLPNLCLFAQGTQEYPDRSTTLVVEIEAFEGGRPLVLTGPGIRTEEEIAPLGLPDMFPHFWSENRQGFPRGVDLILVAGDGILCLPRTTVLRVKSAAGEA
ncbi:phosphonate C-P lyase system protein PhnH [Sinorhizobium sp. RAC02]|uniref:phosphonate C-P lyase system protein PhnH n=1 Tax=Sinorhizobium sp. RAC02 TaxID=1842534 RepID=UPI00083D9404|nr:phosphonate C-P lyase system protein PhnH [Sinorhizobium sp. RAC02]AOF93842.1 phosphonate C-P lyase system protein PhnH [Sinorhizobium sp. RAC02]